MTSVSSSGPREGDLVRRVVLSLELARQILDDLAPAGPAGAPVPERTVGDGLCAKVVAETCLLLHAVQPLQDGQPRIGALMSDLVDTLVPLARSVEVLAAVFRDPAHALDHAMPHVLLSRLGREDGGFEAQVTASAAAGRRIGPEILPHRRLERAWIDRLRQPAAGRSRDEAAALSASALGRPLDVLRADRADLYAFTHAILYVTDAGRRPAVRLGRRRREIEGDALAALGFALDTGDHDVAVELLWTWPMLGMRWHPGALFALDHLMALQDALGLLPGRGFESAPGVSLPQAQRERQVRRTCYHTNYVMGFLCAAALRPGRLPPSGTPRRPSARARPGAAAGAAIAADLALLLADETGPAPWLVRALAQVAREPCGLSSLMMSVGLRRLAARGDLAALQRALETAHRWGLDDGPAAAQGAALLRRAHGLAQHLALHRPAGPSPSSPAAARSDFDGAAVRLG